MNTLIALLIASLATATAVALTQSDLDAILAEGTAKTTKVADINRSGTLAAATVKWQLDKGLADTPTPEMLVQDGYLDPKFLVAD